MYGDPTYYENHSEDECPQYPSAPTEDLVWQGDCGGDLIALVY